ncbi:DUF1173 family protein [Nitrospira sp. Kam-Ns4a]
MLPSDSPRIGWVLCDEQAIALTTVLASAASRAQWLARGWRQPGRIRCACVPGGLPLGVKYYAAWGTYALYPLHRTDPGRHHPACPLGYRPGSRRVLTLPALTPPQSNAPSQPESTQPIPEPVPTPPAEIITLRPSWPTWHWLTPPQSMNRIKHPAQPESALPVRRARPTRPRAALRLVLDLLWREAGLLEWQPAFTGRRTIAVVAARLRSAAARLRIRDQCLADWLYLAGLPPDHAGLPPPPAWTRWWAQLAPTPRGRCRLGYILGLWRETRIGPPEPPSQASDSANTTLTQAKPSATWTRLFMRGWPVGLDLAYDQWVHEQQRWELVAPATPSSHPASLRIIADPARPVVLLILVQRHGMRLLVRALAARHVTDTTCWIPCESHAERQLIQHLVTRQRAFYKPLPCTVAPDEAAVMGIPDIVLLDRQDRCVLEVLGRLRDPAYTARWATKCAAYERRQQAYWTWDPQTQPTIPPLPPADPSRPRAGGRATPRAGGRAAAKTSNQIASHADSHAAPEAGDPDTDRPPAGVHHSPSPFPQPTTHCPIEPPLSTYSGAQR